MKKEKTIKLTEQSLREMIDDTIKLIAAGGEGPATEFNAHANDCNRMATEINAYLRERFKEIEGMQHAKSTRVPKYQEGDNIKYEGDRKLYRELAHILKYACDRLDTFMKDNGYPLMPELTPRKDRITLGK